MFLIPPGEVGCCVAWELLSIPLKGLEAMVGEKASPLGQKPDQQKMDGRAATTENLAKYIFMILVTPPQDLHNLPSRINYKCIFDSHYKATL